MPRTARFHIAAVGELLRQLRFAPPETRARQMEAAEALAAEIDPAQNYPEEFVVYRITGFRPDREEATATFVGAALRGDLANFVLQLSAGLSLPASRANRTAISIEAAAHRLGVSTKSIQRYRRQGLVCHFVIHEDGCRRLACYEDSLERFRERERVKLAEAGAFTRIDRAVVQAMVDAARQMRRERGVSLNEAALELARRHGRAHETVRLILRREEHRAEAPVFDDPPPLTRAEARRLDRAARWGVDIARLAERFGRTHATIRRVINRERAEVLRGFEVRAVLLPTFDRPDARRVILSARAASRELTALSPHEDAATLMAGLRAARDIDDKAALAMLAAYNFLKHEAGAGLAELPPWPGGPALDRIETDLRWAALLKRKLVATALPAALTRIEITLNRPLQLEPLERVTMLLRLAVDVASRQVEAIDPGARQRLERMTSLAMDRALAARNLGAAGERRAAARHGPGAAPLRGLFENLCAWQSRLLLGERLRRRLEGLEEIAREAMELRYGLAGLPPRSVDEIAAMQQQPPRAVARLLNAAEARVRAFRATGG